MERRNQIILSSIILIIILGFSINHTTRWTTPSLESTDEGVREKAFFALCNMQYIFSSEGHVFPGACLPFGMVKVGLDTDFSGEFQAGYTVTGVITGISRTFTWEAKYGVISQLPIVVSLSEIDLSDIKSPRSFERFTPGYSIFGLKRYNITVELTATRRAALHRYTYPENANNNSHVIIDISHFLHQVCPWCIGKFHDGTIYSVNNTQVKGMGRYSGGWNQGGPYKVYFCSQFDTPAIFYSTWWNFIITNTSFDVGADGHPFGAILTFDTNSTRVIRSRVGISFISATQACQNAESEIPYFDFMQIKSEAIKAWERELEKIVVEGGDNETKTIFYSSLYRTMLMPSDRTGENPKWESFDKNGKIIPHYDDFYTLWDTFRVTNPLYTLFQPKRQVDIVRSLIDIYKNEGYMPDGRSGMENGITQGGSNADMVLAETFIKNIDRNSEIDWSLAYQALLEDAEVDPWSRGLYEGRLYLNWYKKLGYIPIQVLTRMGYFLSQCSRTLEYAANDYTISLVAKGMNKEMDYVKYRNRSRNWENLWYPKEFQGFTGFILPRYSDGKFYTEWNVMDTYGGQNPFYEGTSWEYSFYVPHDIKKLIELSGGPIKFEERLDKTFNNDDPYRLYLNEYFNIGNEPSFLTPCLYHYIGKQWKSVKLIRDIMKTMFGSNRFGIPGNDDSGAMGAWYVFHAIGIFPNAGQDVYFINSPHFKNVTIKLSDSSDSILTILAYNLSPTNIYVQLARLNGKFWEKTWFRHSDIGNGGKLELWMGENVSETWGVGKYLIYPPSLSDEVVETGLPFVSSIEPDLVVDEVLGKK
ncbi:2633_t:CDS:10 [Acaulospora morrowiae]|uniref:2633_t:CDS:1 n=1 Tax=Acaulospora morrowiae TaxID=94023 RepID=A0A9N9C5J0_9GLOM|nr:2633_t:CDS:10 [Acaulospora morrowiae]